MFEASAQTTQRQAIEAAHAARSEAFVGLFRGLTGFFMRNTERTSDSHQAAPVASAC